MADFSHLGIVNTEIRSNTPTTKAFDKEEPGIDQGSFPGQMTPTFAAVALPGMSGREVSFRSLLFAHLCRVALDAADTFRGICFLTYSRLCCFLAHAVTRPELVMFAQRVKWYHLCSTANSPGQFVYYFLPSHSPSSPLPPPDSSSTFFLAEPGIDKERAKRAR